MKIVKVTYTTTAEFAEPKQNIKAVMAELRSANHNGINYNACLCADNITFIHTAFFETEEDQKALNEIPAFKSFQEQLKSSGFEVPPKQELLTLIDSSKEIF